MTRFPDFAVLQQFPERKRLGEQKVGPIVEAILNIYSNETHQLAEKGVRQRREEALYALGPRESGFSKNNPIVGYTKTLNLESTQGN